MNFFAQILNIINNGDLPLFLKVTFWHSFHSPSSNTQIWVSSCIVITPRHKCEAQWPRFIATHATGSLNKGMASTSENSSTKTSKSSHPGKVCCLTYCSKSQRDKVSVFAFPKDESLKRKWMNFVTLKRDRASMKHKKGWFYICSDHFSQDDLDVYLAYQGGFLTKMTLRKGAIPCKYPIPTPEQLDAERRAYQSEKKRGLHPKQTSLPGIQVKDGETATVKRRRRERVSQKLEASRVSSN